MFVERLRLERTQFFQGSDAMLERELPKVLAQVPPGVADAAVLARRAAAQAQGAAQRLGCPEFSCTNLLVCLFSVVAQPGSGSSFIALFR